MVARAAFFRRTIPFPPRSLLAVLGGGAALDGMTGLVVLSAGNAYLLRTLNAPAALPAVALALHALTKVAVSPLAGRLADRRRASVFPLVPGLAVLGLTVMLAAHSITGYLAGVAALTASTSTAWVLVRNTIGTLTTSTDRSRATTWMSLVAGGASAAGFATGTVLSGVEARAAFALAFVLVAATAVLLNVTRRSADRHVQEAPALAPRVELDRLGSITLGLVAAGQFALSAGLLVVFWPYVLRDLDLPAVGIAALLIPAGFTTLAVLVAVSRWSRPERRLGEVAALYAVIAIGLAVALTAEEAAGFAVAMTAVIPALAGTVPVVTAAVIDFSRGRAGPAGALGWLGSAEAVGSLAGAGLIGAVIAGAGTRGALAVLTVLAASLACAIGISLRAIHMRMTSRSTP